MAYEVTARRWRPQEFDAVIGQSHVTTTLKNAIASNQMAHAYLFAGPRGVGKTTTARILAKALNCVEGPTVTPCNTCAFCREITEGRSVDVLEIDGASNNKVEQIRTHLLESIKYTPSQGKHKIYIIDEVHMLTKEAFNALLKTLEEPPAHVYFIFATTDPQKVLPTILSRCQRFDFRRISGQTIVDHLAMIAEHHGYQIEKEALAVVARRADGSLRDAESLFDQVVAFGGEALNAHDVASVLGMIEQDVYFELFDIVVEHDASRGLKLIDRILHQGYNIDEIALGIIEHLRNLLIVKASPETPGLLDTAAVDIDRYRAQADRFETEDLLRLTRLATDMEEAIKHSALPRAQLEVGVVRMVRLESSVLLTDVMKQLSELAQRLDTGGGAAPSTAPHARTEQAPEKPPQTASPRNSATPSSKEKTAQTSIASTPPGTASVAPSTQPESDPNAPGAEPAKATVASPTPSTHEHMILSDLIQLWPNIQDRIKQKRIALGNFLAAATIVGFSNDVITLGFTPRQEFHKQQAEKKEHTELIRETFTEILGSPVRIVCTTTDESRSEETVSQTVSEQDSPRASDGGKTDAEQDPAVKKIMEAFNGTIVM